MNEPKKWSEILENMSEKAKDIHGKKPQSEERIKFQGEFKIWYKKHFKSITTHSIHV